MIEAEPPDMFGRETGSCNFCSLFVNDIDTWSCEQCTCVLCEECGKLDNLFTLFLCPDCFYNPPVVSKSTQPG